MLACEQYQTTKGSGNSTPHPSFWSHIGINLLGALKEIDGYRYIVTAVDYTSKFLRHSL